AIANLRNLNRFQSLTFRDVVHDQKNLGGIVLFARAKLPRIKKDCAEADSFEIMSDFEIIEETVPRHNFCQKFAQLWNIPSAIAQFINEASFGFSGGHFKVPVKSGVRPFDPQI